jgi:hypothetical protein
VYLRDNLLSSLEGVEILKGVKVFLELNFIVFPPFAMPYIG